MPKIEFSNYEGGREQAYVKHSLLENYLGQLVYRVGQAWDAIVYVDGFAGPWGCERQTLCGFVFWDCDASAKGCRFGIEGKVRKGGAWTVHIR
jgi:hypothetical protein